MSPLRRCLLSFRCSFTRAVCGDGGVGDVASETPLPSSSLHLFGEAVLGLGRTAHRLPVVMCCVSFARARHRRAGRRMLSLAATLDPLWVVVGGGGSRCRPGTYPVSGFKFAMPSAVLHGCLRGVAFGSSVCAVWLRPAAALPFGRAWRLARLAVGAR